MDRARRAAAILGLAAAILGLAAWPDPAAAQDSDVPGTVLGAQHDLVISRLVQNDGQRSQILVTNTAPEPRCALIQYRHNGLALDSPPTRWLRYKPGTTGRLSQHVVRRGKPELTALRIDREPTVCMPLKQAGTVAYVPKRRFEPNAYLAARGAVGPDGGRLALVEWQTSQLCLYRMPERAPTWCTSNFPDAAGMRTAGVAFTPDGGTVVTARAVTTRTDGANGGLTRGHAAVLTGYAGDGGDVVFRREIAGIAHPRTVTGVAAGPAGPDGALRGVLAHAPPAPSDRPGTLYLAGPDGAAERIATEGYRPAGVAFIRGGDALAAWGGDRVVIHDPEDLTVRRMHTLPADLGPRGGTLSALSPDGSRVAVAHTRDGEPELAVYDVARGKRLWTRGIPGPGTARIDHLAFRDDLAELLVSLSDNSGYLLNATTGATRFGMTEASPWTYFPDGARILLLARDLVWRPERPLPGGG